MNMHYKWISSEDQKKQSTFVWKGLIFFIFVCCDNAAVLFDVS